MFGLGPQELILILIVLSVVVVGGLQLMRMMKKNR